MAKLVSTTYGDALFELGLEQGNLDLLYEEAGGLQKTFSDNDELLKLLNHPKIIKEEKQKILKNVFSGRVSPDMEGFLHIIVEKDRYREIPAITSSMFRGLSSFMKLFMPELSSWNTPSVRPVPNEAYTAASS